MVNPIQPVTVAGADNQLAANAAANAANYDAFLQLLVTQLRNQDPTKPQDSSEFLSQLASFSSVEQQIQTNQSLNSLIAGSKLSVAAELIGKTVSANGEQPGRVVAVLMQDGQWFAETDAGAFFPVGDGIRISENE